MAETPNPSPQGLPPSNSLKQLEHFIEQKEPGVLRRLNSEERRALMRAMRTSLEAVSFQMQVVRQGPLPDPEDLAKYNQIIPEGADRIMKMAERQSAHRIEIEKTVINSQQVQSQRGQYFGLVAVFVGVGASVYLAMNGHDVVAGVLGGTTVVSLAIAFITGRKAQQRDLQQKRIG
jgi:uncharacterized membrane protein